MKTKVGECIENMEKVRGVFGYGKLGGCDCKKRFLNPENGCGFGNPSYVRSRERDEEEEEEEEEMKPVVGMVVSNKMQKSVVVAVDRLFHHKLYNRYVKRTSKFMAHDENNECSIGDRVI